MSPMTSLTKMMLQGQEPEQDDDDQAGPQATDATSGPDDADTETGYPTPSNDDLVQAVGLRYGPELVNLRNDVEQTKSRLQAKQLAYVGKCAEAIQNSDYDPEKASVVFGHLASQPEFAEHIGLIHEAIQQDPTALKPIVDEVADAAASGGSSSSQGTQQEDADSGPEQGDDDQDTGEGRDEQGGQEPDAYGSDGSMANPWQEAQQQPARFQQTAQRQQPELPQQAGQRLQTQRPPQAQQPQRPPQAQQPGHLTAAEQQAAAAMAYSESTRGTVAEHEAVISVVVNRARSGGHQYVDSGDPVTVDNVIHAEDQFQGVGRRDRPGRNFGHFAGRTDQGAQNARTAAANIAQNGPTTTATHFLFTDGTLPTPAQVQALGHVHAVGRAGNVFLYATDPPPARPARRARPAR